MQATISLGASSDIKMYYLLIDAIRVLQKSQEKRNLEWRYLTRIPVVIVYERF